MWRIIVGIYDGHPRLTNDRKWSHRVGTARKWLGRVGNARKVFGEVHPYVISVRICIQSQGWLISGLHMESMQNPLNLDLGLKSGPDWCRKNVHHLELNT